MNRGFRLIVAAAVAAVSLGLAAPAVAAKEQLKFSADGRFRIVQFTDTQDGPNLDPRTLAGMQRILDAEKPDLVVITGDCVDTGKCSSRADLERAIGAIAAPMEQREVPWAVTFGNHDRDNIGKIGITQDQMLSIYMRYPHNLNRQSPNGVYGAGNSNLLVNGRGGKPALNVWLVDSNAYVPADVGGQKLGGYDWVRQSQVRWYVDTSKSLEKRWGRKLPSLMFFHIPVPEFADLAASGKFEGEKNEDVAASKLNGGLFAAALERGDVLGMFAGHEHVNTFIGSWYGIRLAYGGSIGYATYGLGGPDEQNFRLKGARVLDISEADPAAFTTRYVRAESFK